MEHDIEAPMNDAPVTETPVEATPAELDDLFGDGPPASAATEIPAETPNPDAVVPPQTPPAAVAIEEFDIDGRKVNKDALFQTYRQFSHLQQRHQEVKPYLDLMQEIGLTPDQVPQFRAWVAAQINASASPAPSAPAGGIDQESWFQEVAETFPQFAAYLKQEIAARQEAESRFTKLEETLGSFTTAVQDRQRQEQAVGILGSAADHINAMMDTFPRLQDPQVRGAFLRWLWDEQQPGAKIADPKFLRGMYMVFDEAALAEQWEAKANASRTAHAATVTRGFAETGAPRAASSTTQLSPHERELAEVFSD